MENKNKIDFSPNKIKEVELQEGKKYLTKFQQPEEVILNRIIPSGKKGMKPIFGYVTYCSNPNMGECPLNLDRINPQEIKERGIKITFKK